MTKPTAPISSRSKITEREQLKEKGHDKHSKNTGKSSQKRHKEGKEMPPAKQARSATCTRRAVTRKYPLEQQNNTTTTKNTGAREQYESKIYYLLYYYVT